MAFTRLSISLLLSGLILSAGMPAQAAPEAVNPPAAPAALNSIGDVSGHVPMREEQAVLEDHSAVSPVRRQPRDVDPSDAHLAASGLQPRDSAQKTGFSGARRTEQGDDLALGHGQVDAVDGDVPVGIDHAEIGDLQKRRTGLAHFDPSILAIAFDSSILDSADLFCADAASAAFSAADIRASGPDGSSQRNMTSAVRSPRITLAASAIP